MKSALAAAGFDLRTAAPELAADLTRHVADLLDRAHAAGLARRDATAGDVMALAAGAFAAIRHAGAEASRQHSAHIAQIILDGLRPQTREAGHAPGHRGSTIRSTTAQPPSAG